MCLSGTTQLLLLPCGWPRPLYCSTRGASQTVIRSAYLPGRTPYQHAMPTPNPQYARRLQGDGAGVNGFWSSDRNLLTFDLPEAKTTVEIDVSYYKTWLVCGSLPAPPPFSRLHPRAHPKKLQKMMST